MVELVETEEAVHAAVELGAGELGLERLPPGVGEAVHHAVEVRVPESLGEDLAGGRSRGCVGDGGLECRGTRQQRDASAEQQRRAYDGSESPRGRERDAPARGKAEEQRAG